MLFKKNKPNSPPVDPGNASPSLGEAAMGSSLFAPGLNPHAMPIDFGFDRVPSAPAPSYVVPAPPSDFLSHPQPAESSWQSEMPTPEAGMYSQPSMPELLNETTFAEPSASPPLMPAVPMASPPAVDPAYLGETFENYSAPPASFGEEQSASTPWTQPAFEETGDWNQGVALASNMSFEAFGFENPEAQAPFSESYGLESPSASLDLSADWSALSGPSAEPILETNTLGDLMPWEQSQGGLEPSYTPSAEALWEQLGSGDTVPGEQVPMAPGAFMDSMHQQLYPEDPLSTGYDELVEGEQAFEDAAQFLFPDTVSAPLDWQADSSLSPEGMESFGAPSGFPQVEDFSPQPLDLGPSVQSTVSEFSDISGYYPDALQSSIHQEMSTVLPEPVGDPFNASAMADLAPTEFENYNADEPLAAEAFDPFTLEATAPDLSVPNTPQIGFEAQPVSSEAPYSQADSWAAESWDAPPESPHSLDFALDASVGLSVQPVASSFLEEVFEDDAASMAWESTSGAASLSDGVPAFELSALSDQDFYATDFTLNEQGELVPVAEQSAATPSASFMASVPEMPSSLAPNTSALFLDDAILAPPADDTFELPLEPMVGNSLAPEAATEPLSAFHSASGPELELSAGEALWDQWGSGKPLGEPHAEPQIEFQSPSLEEFSVEATNEFLSIEPGTFAAESYVASDSNFFEVEAPILPVTSETTEPDFGFASTLPDNTPVSPFNQMSMPPILPTPVVPMAAASALEVEHLPDASGPLETQWEETASEIGGTAVQPSVAKPPAEFSLSDIEVLGVCPLAGERRLLLVSSNGIFALMGQVGLQQPQIAVLKLFEHNPLAYQNTFTAVAEGQAEAQGMFVTQLGTWRGIISTFQDKITLHTDLG